MATFITSKAVGQTISIGVVTSTGYWKYYHNGTYSSVFESFWEGPQITIANANGEFTIISCLSDGTPSGEITGLYLGNYNVNNQIISFDGTGLSSLTHLRLSHNGLSSLSGFTIPFSLTWLDINNNQLTSFDGTGLSSLTHLNLENNQLTSFDGTGLSGLTYLNLYNNQLTGFTGTDLSSLTELGLNNNPLTTFNGTGLSSLTTLNFPNDWGITTLESINVSGMTSLRVLILDNSEDIGNPGVSNPQSNDAILAQLAANQLANEWEYGAFYTAGGRTQSGSADYYYLQSNGWEMYGLSIPLPPLSSLTPTFTTSKVVGESVLIGISTSTGYWRYQHGGVDSGVYNGGQWIQVTNGNGEFALISCDVDGFPSGDITELSLSSEESNQITSFNGTGLSGLINLNIENNQLTEFDGTGLSSLNELNLKNNQLTSFDGTGLSSLTRLELPNNNISSLDNFTLPTSLTQLILDYNQLTSFDGTGLSSLTVLVLSNNQLTSIDISGLNVLTFLYTRNNPLTPSINDSLLSKLAANQLANEWPLSDVPTGGFYTSGGGTAAGTTDYDYLIANGWLIQGAAPPPTQPVTFVTSKSVGQSINANIQTTTGYWKYYHNGTYSSVFESFWEGPQITIANANGEFTIISCLINGIPSGEIISMNLGNNNQLTSFDGTGLSGLTSLNLSDNQLTSFDGTGLSSLTVLDLYNNLLTSFDGTGLSSLLELGLGFNQLTSFDGTGLSSLTNLGLGYNLLTSFDGTGLSSLTELNLYGNPLTSFNGGDMGQITFLDFPNNFGISTLESFDGTGLSSLTNLGLGYNLLTSFDGTGLSSLTELNLYGNPLTSFNGGDMGQITFLDFPNNFGISTLESFDGTGLSSLTQLYLGINQLTSFTGTGLSSLTQLYLQNNQLTSFDGTGLSSLTQLYLQNNQLTGFTGTGLSSLTTLELYNNQLTSFDGTGLSSLTQLYLTNNQLTSFDGTGLSSLIYLWLQNNTILNTPENNDTILAQLASLGTSNGQFYALGGRTAASDVDYDILISRGWNIQLVQSSGGGGGSYGGYYYYYGGSGIGEDNLIVRKLRVKGVRQINRLN